jgi:alpha-L-rhamnosidase
MDRAGEFISSNELLNKIHRNMLWGIRGNYRSIPTDCPQRDERQGWLGRPRQVSRSESYMFDVAAFYSADDRPEDQRPSGSIPDVSPNYWTLYNDDLTWPGTIIFVHGMLYDQYADKRVLARGYEAMKKWIDYEKTFVKDGLISKDQYADWCVPPEDPKLIHSKDPARVTDKTLIATSYYYELLRQMSRYARILDKPTDAAEFDRRSAATRTSSSGASSNWRAACTITARRPPVCCRSTSAWCRKISVRPWCRPWCAISNKRATITWARAWWARSG